MRILVADPELRLHGLLRTVLEPQGHEIFAAGDAAGCRTLLFRAEPDLVLIDVDLPGGGPLEALAFWRARAAGRDAHVVLTSGRGRGGPRIGEIQQRLSAKKVLSKPFSMLDLGDTIAALVPVKRAAPPAPVPAPASAPVPVRDPAADPRHRVRPSGVDQLTRLLGRGGPRRSPAPAPAASPTPTPAAARVAAPPPAAVAVPAVPPARAVPAAPVDPAADSPTAPVPPAPRPHVPMRANRSLIPRSGGAVSRDNAARIGALWAGQETGLLHITGAAVPVRRPVRFRDGGLVDARELDLIDLALRDGRLRFEAGPVEGMGDPRALGAYLVQACRDPGAGGFAAAHTFSAPQLRKLSLPLTELPVGRDTRAVLAKADGRQTLGRLLAMLSIPPESVENELACLHRLGLLSLLAPRARRASPAAPGGVSEPVSGVSSGRGGAAHREPRSVPTESATAATHPGRRRGEPSSVPATSPATSPRTSPATSPRTNTSVRRRRRDGSTRTHRTNPSRRRIPQVPAATLEKQLRRELARVEGASPAHVLGVPHDAGTELVKGVAARQRQRYQRLADDPANSADIRELAAALVKLVEEAEGKWGSAAKTHTGATDSERELAWLEQGRALFEQGAYLQADRVLSKARDLTIANPDILAWLGLARMRNPSHPVEQRTEEGIDLLLLAEQFNPDHLVAVSWLARTLATQGARDRALARAKRWVRLDPSDSEAKALVAKLEREKAAEA